MTEQVFEAKLKEKEKEKENFFKMVLTWIVSHLQFLLIPGSRIEELTLREIEYEKSISQRKFIRRLKSTLTIIGIVIVFVVVTLAIFPEWIAPYSYEIANSLPGGSWDPPSADYLLGQTEFGRDILSRMIYGARASLTIALPAISFSVIFGVIVGIIAAFYGGWVDTIIMRIVDIFLAFPGLILAMVFIGLY